MSELMFTGWQVVGCAVMCLAAGVGVGVYWRGIIEALSMPDCKKCEEEGNPDCPYWGEPNGCNNRGLMAKVRGWEGK